MMFADRMAADYLHTMNRQHTVRWTVPYTYAAGDPINGNDFSGLMYDEAGGNGDGGANKGFYGGPDGSYDYQPGNSKSYAAAKKLGEKLYQAAKSKASADHAVDNQCRITTTSGGYLNAGCVTATLAANDAAYNDTVDAAARDALAAGLVPFTTDANVGIEDGFYAAQRANDRVQIAILVASIVLPAIAGAVLRVFAASADTASIIAETAAISSTDATTAGLTVASAATKGGAGPGLQGTAGVARTVQDWTAGGGKILGQEVTIEAGGVRVRPDLYAQDACGVKCFIEVKTGPGAGFTANQKVGYPALQAVGGVPRGANAAQARLIPGDPIGPTPVILVRQPWPL